MRIATWNIFWLGDRTGEKIHRSESDYASIAQVITHLKPDVLALEEIVDPAVMEHILSLVNAGGQDYILKTGQSHWLTSDADPTSSTSNIQKPFLCINNKTIELVKAAAIEGGPFGRKPYAAKLRERSSGKEFIAVAVHLRSGFPSFLDEGDAAVRVKEVEALRRWLDGAAVAANGSFPGPDCDDVLIFGDFNAEMDEPNQSLALFTTGSMAKWTWNKPRPDGEHWETALYEGDRYVIDFIMFSESLAKKVTSPPTIYAWDHDPEMGGSAKFHVGPNGSGNLKGYGVSDHRPVIAEVKL